MVNMKLSAIDGHMRISSYISDKIPMKEIEVLDSIIYQYSPDIKSTSPYIKKHAIVKNGLLTEGIIIYGVIESSLDSIFHLHQFTSKLSKFNNEQSIIIGSKLAKSLNVIIGDNIMIMDIEKIAHEQILHAHNFNIINIFQTDFPEYDRLLAFIQLDTAEIFFGMDNSASGLILNLDNPENVDMLESIINQKMDMYPYMITTWKQRHSSLLEWLTLYDIPIKLIMIFIIAVGIFNTAASLWMIIIEKTKDIGIMKSMGLNDSNIQQIIVKEGAIIGLAGAIGGIVLSSVVLYLQTTYHFITLSNDIYFMDYLPVQLDPIYFLFYPSCAFFITIAFSYFPALKATKSTPAQSLRYE